MNENERYWGLPTLAYLIRWLMELVALLSKPLLMIGAGVSVFVWLTDGSVLSIPLIYYGWALIQAIAVEALFYVIWHNASTAWRGHHPLVFTGNVLLGTALSVCVWAAIDLQSLQQVLRIGNSDALSMLNLNPVMLTHLRSLAAVVLSIVVAMRSVENRDVNIQPRRIKVNIHCPQWLLDFMAKMRTLWTSIVNTKQEVVNTESKPLPVEIPNPESEQETPAKPVRKTNRKVINLAEASTKKERVRQALEANPQASISDLVKSTGASRGYVSQQRSLIVSKQQTSS
jgi:hypothetical protein